MKNVHRPTALTLGQRLRVDARLLHDRPSEAARQRLRAALEGAPTSPAAVTRPSRRPLRFALPTAAAAAVLLWTCGPWLRTTAPAEAEGAGAGVPVPEILASLLSVHPIDAMEFISERPLRGELDALGTDAVAVADAVLRRIPRPLVPNRRRDGGAPRRSPSSAPNAAGS